MSVSVSRLTETTLLSVAWRRGCAEQPGCDGPRAPSLCGHAGRAACCFPAEPGSSVCVSRTPHSPALFALCPPSPSAPRRELCIHQGRESRGKGWGRPHPQSLFVLCRRLTPGCEACGSGATRSPQSSPDPASGHRRPALVLHTSFNILVSVLNLHPRYWPRCS